MHRNRTWTLDPPEWRTQRNRLLPIEGGDGSTLNLDFTKGVLDPRLNFSRLGTATFVNSSGYVEWAGANLCPYSQQINVGTWLVGASATLTPNTTDVLDPQGGNTATKIALAANVYNSRAMSLALPGGMTYTFSYWIRGTAGNQCRIYSNAGYVGDLVTETSYSYSTTAWTRVSTTFTTNVATTNVFLYVCAKQTFPATTDTIYVWGAQLNPGSTAQTYYPTTTAAYHGPRFDYNPTTIGLSRGLLIETSAVNYVLFSGLFANAPWTLGTGQSSDVTLSVNTTETLDPFGLNTAAKLTKPNTVSGYGFIRQTSMSSGTSAGVRTISIWVKQPTTGAARYFGLRSTGDGFVPGTGSYHATFDLLTGTVVANIGTSYYTNVSIVSYRNGWYRISATTGNMLGTGTLVTSYSIVRATDGEENTTEVGSVYIWGPQLELGSGTSSYIPTGASAGNRVDDSLTIPDGSWLNKSEINSTWLFEGSLDKTVSNFGSLLSYITTGDYSGQNRIFIATDTTQTRFYHYARSAAGVNFEAPISDAYPNAYNFNTSFRIAATFNNVANKNIASLNSAPSFGTVTTASLTTPTYTTISIGSNNNWHIQKIKYYPVSLSQSELNVITSPNYVAPSFSVNFVPMSSEADLLASGLTFKRLTNATFINTAGFVDFAGANMFPNSAFNDANPTPSGWTAFGLSATATITIPSDTEARKVTTTSASEQPFIYVAPSVTQGLVYTVSIQILEVTDPTAQYMSYSQCLSAPFASSAVYYMNGQSKGTGTGTITGETGILSIVYTAGSSSQIRIGYANVPKSNCSITFKAPQHQQGEVINRSTFYRRTFAEGTYYAPRFDNKVLTSRTNLILQSNSFITGSTLIAPWAQKYGANPVALTANYTAAGTPVGFSDPVTRFVSTVINSGITQPLNIPVVAGKVAVLSFFMKSNSANEQYIQVSWNSLGDLYIVTATSGWTRAQIPLGTAITEITLSGYLASLDISICGMQVEYVTAPNNPSAYIPTTTTTTTVNTTEPIGLLNEGVSTNNLYYSQNLTLAPWTIQALGSGSYTTVSLTGGVAPDNTNTAIRFIEGTGSFSRSIYQSVALSANTYTASVFVKAGYGDLRYIRLVLASAAGNYVHATVNITTGAVTQGPAVAGTGVSTPKVTVTPYAGSWYRISVTAYFTAATNFFFIVPSNVATPAQNTGDYNRLDYVGNGASFLLWGAQVELGEGLTSYIPTGTTTVQRTPDLLAVTSATAMGLNVLEGTFFTETELPRGGLGQPALFGAPYGNNSWLGQLYNTSDATSLSANWWGAGIAAISRGSATKTVSALSYGLYTGMTLPISSSLNGVVTTAMLISSNGNHVPNPSAWGFISLASNLTALSSTPRDNLHACIKRFSYYPTRLTNAQLIALTA